ncbi:MAG: hypothetical protein GXC76_08565 [Rhodanobacteraceae bacterium]|jgi:hypothetical protein|nr:hypothetical protein [Rhodanobacteraceae bacterium]
MFLGHFALAFAAKPLARRVSLGTLFLAAQFIDLLWPSFLLLGLERVRIEPGAIGLTPLAFEHYPWSHSLLAVLGWAIGFAAVHFALRRSGRNAIVLGALVLSHWLLDLVVHRPDLPLYPGESPLFGFGLWALPSWTFALETALFLLGLALYLRMTRPRDRAGRWLLAALVGFLFAIHLSNQLGAPPPNVTALAWVGQAQWLLVALAYWVDRHRLALRAA